MKPIIQKTPNRVNQKLRDSPKDCPMCMGCGLPNPDGNLLCLAHSNRLMDGKGRGLKATDETGAILCLGCHDLCDGRAGNWTREKKREFHQKAAKKTHEWWVKMGLVKA
jgi:hypothetical protein